MTRASLIPGDIKRADLSNFLEIFRRYLHRGLKMTARVRASRITPPPPFHLRLFYRGIETVPALVGEEVPSGSPDEPAASLNLTV